MATWAGIECVQTIGDVDVPTIKCLEAVFTRVLTVAVSLAILALFVMLVVGGFKYLTSGGDQKATASAKQTMTYAILGLGLMIVAYIIFLLIETITGVGVLNFVIPDFAAPTPAPH